MRGSYEYTPTLGIASCQCVHDVMTPYYTIYSLECIRQLKFHCIVQLSEFCYHKLL